MEVDCIIWTLYRIKFCLRRGKIICFWACSVIQTWFYKLMMIQSREGSFKNTNKFVYTSSGPSVNYVQLRFFNRHARCYDRSNSRNVFFQVETLVSPKEPAVVFAIPPQRWSSVPLPPPTDPSRRLPGRLVDIPLRRENQWGRLACGRSRYTWCAGRWPRHVRRRPYPPGRPAHFRELRQA